jgi:phage shock protein C
MDDKRLYRSDTNYKIFGVCGGIGEYLNVDPTVIRLLWVVFSLAGGSGIIAYIIAALIMPSR